jgi:predicted glycogen debranching enzyme
VELSKSVFMIQGENAVVVQYRLEGSSECLLELRPLIAFRDFHATTHANGALNASVTQKAGLASIQPYRDLPVLHFAHDAKELLFEAYWNYSFQYDRERERGLDFAEDLFHPFTLVFDLKREGNVIASLKEHQVSEAGDLMLAERARRQGNWTVADSFIVDRAEGKSVIAGYHWFGDWGRDTMIALPGLTLATGKPDVARDILTAFSQFISEGMLPNRFPDRGEQPEYNTVDATLWYFEAIRAWLAATGDVAFVKAKLLPALRGIIGNAIRHPRGRRWIVTGRRTRSTAHVDGRKGGRLCGDAEARKAGGDSGALVQRIAGYPIAERERALRFHGGPGAEEFCAAVLEPGHRLSVRSAWRRIDPPESTGGHQFD